MTSSISVTNIDVTTKFENEGVFKMMTPKLKSYILTEKGQKSEKCNFLTMDEPTFSGILWKNQTQRFQNIYSLPKL